MTAAPLPVLVHFGRSWHGHPLEDDCPCRKAACGLVEYADDDCPEHGWGAGKTIRQAHPADVCPVLSCGCWTCSTARLDAAGVFASVGMIVCPDCGNKRCPRATHHDQPCTGSNEPGQTGSRYA